MSKFCGAFSKATRRSQNGVSFLFLAYLEKRVRRILALSSALAPKTQKSFLAKMENKSYKKAIATEKTKKYSVFGKIFSKTLDMDNKKLYNGHIKDNDFL